MKRLILALLACAMAAGSLVPPLAYSQQDKPPAQAQVAAGKQQGQRSAQDIQTDLRAVGNELRGTLSGPDVLFDPEKRQQQAPKAIPVLKKMIVLFDELAQAEPTEKDDLQTAKLDFQSMLIVLGDADAKTALEKQATSRTPAEATSAQLALLLANWWKGSKDATAQGKVLDEVQKLAKAQPQSDAVAVTLMKMSQAGPADEKLADRARDIVATDLKGPIAQQIAGQMNADRKLKEMAGKPIDIAGTKVDGSQFSTKDWKGKVILVDFWATWCGPCIAELPRVKKTYQEFHPKGLEILGVSCDSDVKELQAFMAKNTDMPWPQLFDAKENPKLNWHPLAKQYGINGIPTMFLIDKKGILRTVEARENFEELIPKMLEEK